MGDERRKHRVVVEVTLDEPGTAKDAVWAIKNCLYYFKPKPYPEVTKVEVKEYDRVVRAEEMKKNKGKQDAS